MKTRLLEHVALLEGMLDRMRYFCIEPSNAASNTGTQLADRLCRGTLRFVVSLLHILFDVNPDTSVRAPLLWHDVLLNSAMMKKDGGERTAVLYRGLQQMYQLFHELDTKSTNL